MYHIHGITKYKGTFKTDAPIKESETLKDYITRSDALMTAANQKCT